MLLLNRKISIIVIIDNLFRKYYMYIYIPESATRSIVLRPWAANLDFSSVRFKKGAGRVWLASALFAVRLSLLPSGTGQLGPPVCEYIYLYHFKTIYTINKRSYTSLLIEILYFICRDWDSNPRSPTYLLQKVNF
jgi:hypothetical protein